LLLSINHFYIIFIILILSRVIIDYIYFFFKYFNFFFVFLNICLVFLQLPGLGRGLGRQSRFPAWFREYIKVVLILWIPAKNAHLLPTLIILLRLYVQSHCSSYRADPGPKKLISSNHDFEEFPIFGRAPKIVHTKNRDSPHYFAI
jgi:hypothetical protein